MGGDFRFGPEYRVRKRSEYLRIYREADKIHTPYFVLYIQENQLSHSRLGVTVSRKIGKTNVRNLIKRRLREVFRHDRVNIDPPCDVVVNAKRRAADADFEELRKGFNCAVERWKEKRKDA